MLPTDEDIVPVVRNSTPTPYSLRPAERVACLLSYELIRIYVCALGPCKGVTVRWPLISIPLPPEPVITVSLSYFGPLLVTPRRVIYILPFTDRFMRHVDMISVAGAAAVTSEGTAKVLINRRILPA